MWRFEEFANRASVEFSSFLMNTSSQVPHLDLYEGAKTEEEAFQRLTGHGLPGGPSSTPD